MSTPIFKVLLICGSHRSDSMTRIAMHALLKRLAKHSVQGTVVDPGGTDGQSVAMLLSDAGGSQLRSQVVNSDGVIFCTPEYNGSFSALLKACIEQLGYPSVLVGKPVALLGVAAGNIGAVKALEHLQSVCFHNGALVVPPYVSIQQVSQHFDQYGNCSNLKIVDLFDALAKSLVDFLRKNHRSSTSVLT